MSEEEIREAGNQEEARTYTEKEVKQMLEQETSGLKSKVEELLGEKKTVSQRAKELEEAQHKAEEARLAEKQQFKELYEREQKAKQELAEKYEEYKGRIQRQEINAQAGSIASELTRDTNRAELLSEKAAQFAKYSDDGVTFELGGVPVDKGKIIEHLKDKYPFLVDGSGASGGGAAGGSKNGGAVKKFNELSGGELAEIKKNDPAMYERLRSDYYGNS